MWQGAHVLPISYNYENKREVLRRPPTGLQLFFKCWHTTLRVYIIFNCKSCPEVTNSIRSYRCIQHTQCVLSIVSSCMNLRIMESTSSLQRDGFQHSWPDASSPQLLADWGNFVAII